MSFYQDITRISVVGSKENVTRMLNAAICNVGTKELIVDGDDIDTVNLKIKEEDGVNGLRVALVDLFDEVCLQDNKLQEKIKTLEGKQEVESECENEEDCLGYDDISFDRMFDLLCVQETEGGYTVDIIIYEDECCNYGGWNYFEDIARLYRCRVISDDELFRNGVSLGLDQTVIWEPEGEEVKETIFRPEKLNHCRDIETAFSPLMQMDAKRYGGYKIQAYDILINKLEHEVNEARVEKEWYQTKEEEDIHVPWLYRDFLYKEQYGIESVKEYHERCIIYNSSEEELEITYKLRVKRCQDKNKKLADFYKQLLANLHADFEKEKERRRKLDEEEKESRVTSDLPKEKNDDLPF